MIDFPAVTYNVARPKACRYERRWVILFAIVAAVQLLIALTVSNVIAYSPSPPILANLKVAGCFVAFTFGPIIFWQAIGLARKGEQNPLPSLLPEHRLLSVIGVFLIGLTWAAHTWLKAMLPHAAPFWADPMLSHLDRAIFGQDPWHYLRPRFDSISDLVSFGYFLWFPSQWFMIAVLVFSVPSALKARSLLSYGLLIGPLGTGTQYLFSSAGPLFYQRLGYGSDFSFLEQHVAPGARQARDYLWANYVDQTAAIGSGISAMPSLHVAIAAWVALVVTARWPRFCWAGWIFLSVIVFGSVYLGWHYAMDSVGGIAISLVAWWLSLMVFGQISDAKLAVISGTNEASFPDCPGAT